jgi:hypothetical protein
VQRGVRSHKLLYNADVIEDTRSRSIANDGFDVFGFDPVNDSFDREICRWRVYEIDLMPVLNRDPSRS